MVLSCSTSLLNFFALRGNCSSGKHLCEVVAVPQLHIYGRMWRIYELFTVSQAELK